MDAVEEVKSRLNIEELVGEYVTLRRAGRNFKGVCPFHSEKTPSFMVNPERGIYHCFGCNQGGDVLSFVMKMEGLEFRAALELLARKSGVDLAQYSSGGRTDTKKKDKILTILGLATKYYQACLIRNDSALVYAQKQRGFNKQTIESFMVGYAPTQGTALVSFLEKRGYQLSDIKDAGLLVSRGDKKDLFRGRLMLPLCDGQGRVVGFTGRLIDKDGFGPKYLNSPQTLVYDKSRNIYGLHLAKQTIREKDHAVLVEGNVDVVIAHQAGFKNIVATAGTALTVEQLKQLSRLCSTIILAFDNDAAGVQATIRGITLAQKVTVNLMVLPISGGKDPDDIIRQDPKQWQQILDKPSYAVDWLIDHYSKTFDLSTAPGKRKMSAALLPVLGGLADSVEQEHYLKVLAQKMDVSLDAVLRQLNPVKATLKKHKTPEETEPDERNMLLDTYLSLLVRYPETRVSMVGVELSLESEREKVWSLLQKDPEINLEKTPDNLHEVTDFVRILMFKAEQLHGSWNAQDRVIESIDLAQRLGKATKRQNLQKISEKVAAAEAEGNEARLKQLLDEYQSALNQE